MAEHQGSCFCGAVKFTMSGAPKAQGFCHCESCRTWGGMPVNAFTIWDPKQMTVTAGASNVGSYSKNPQSVRKFCKTCGGHVWADHPSWGVVDVPASLIPSHTFKPEVHLNYQEKIVAMRDGLPKMKDFPKEMGGSGAAMPE